MTPISTHRHIKAQAHRPTNHAHPTEDGIKDSVVTQGDEHRPWTRSPCPVSYAIGHPTRAHRPILEQISERDEARWPYRMPEPGGTPATDTPYVA